MFEQYGRRNNTEISNYPDSVEQSSLEEKIASVFSNIGVDVTSNDIEICHRIGKSQNNSKKKEKEKEKAIVRFTNGKFAKEGLYNRKKINR